MGLLEKVLANKLTDTDAPALAGIDFYALAEKSGIGSCAILAQIDNYYCFKQFHGFSSQTVIKSIATTDFWDGVLTGDDWHIMTGKKLTPFYQLFSDEDKELIKTLLIKRFTLYDGTSAIWISSDGKTTIPVADGIINDIIKSGIDFLQDDFLQKTLDLSEDKKVNLFEIDFSDTIESLHENDANYSLEMLLSLSRTVFYAASHLCQVLFKKPNICVPSRNSCVRAIIYASCEIDADLLYLQLQKLFTPFFPETAFEALQVYGIGSSGSSASIRSFLQTTD
jgi:hypothetical protein